MEEIKDFAAIVRASNGQQVLFYKESDDGDNTLHCIASFDGYSADIKISGIPDDAFDAMDLEKAGSEMADKIVAQVAELME